MTHAPPLAKKQVWISWDSHQGLRKISFETKIPMQVLLDRAAKQTIADYERNPKAFSLADAAA